MKRSNADPDLGMSLVEVLVVLGIMASALAAYVFWSSALQSRKIHAVAESFRNELMKARMRAMGEGRTVRFLFDVQAKRYGLRLEKTYPDDIQARLTALQDPTLKEGQGAILFFPDGSSSGGVITIRHRGRALSIRVDWLTGAIDVRR